MSLEETRPVTGQVVPFKNIVPNKNRPVNARKIYVMGDVAGDGSGRQVKLGITRQRNGMRQGQHEKRGPKTVEMKWLAGVWGLPADERALKQYWTRKGCLNGGEEWFTANGELRDWLRWLRDQPFTALAEKDMDSVEMVDANKWMPGRNKVKFFEQPCFPFDALESVNPWNDLDTAEVMEGDYYTHETMIVAARQTMETIDLDPASCRSANVGIPGHYRGIRARHFFGLKEDGLSRSWSGNVWLNPPFGQWDRWAPKAVAEYQLGRVPQMCVFCTASAATGRGFHVLVAHANAVFFPIGRFGCWGPNASAAKDGNLIFYFGCNVDRFAEAFGQFGTVYRGAR